MIMPYYKHTSTSDKVEVEIHGVINLSNLPIQVYPEENGYYEIGWTNTHDGKEVLSEYGGANAISFGGMPLGVLKEL